MRIAAIALDSVQAASVAPALRSRSKFSTTLAHAMQESEPPAYTVQAGDNLWGICRERLRQSGTTPTGAAVHDAVRKVAEANGLRDPDLLRIGQTLDLTTATTPEPSAAATDATPVGAAAVPAQVRSAPESAVMPESASVVAPPGLDAGASLSDAVEQLRSSARYVRIPPDVTRFAGERLAAGGPVEAVRRSQTTREGLDEARSKARLRIDELTAKLREILEPRTAKAALDSVTRPWDLLLDTAHLRLTSGYGLRSDPFTGLPEQHDGIDIAAPIGTRVYPYKSGRVVFSGWESGYGRLVCIEHDDGSVTRYGHTSESFVREGQRVTVDTPIGLVGTTGRSTGPHLHFELRVDGRPVDPTPLLQQGSYRVARRD